MGNLFSTPKPPKISAATYTPPPVPPPLSSGGSSPNANPDAPSGAAQDALGQVTSRRGRGLGGTVMTSWQGVLQPNDLIPQRNSLLGE